MSTVFWIGPIIRASADAGAGGDAIFSRITLAMGVNPYFTMAYSIFDDDLLHLPYFYRTDLAGFQYARRAGRPRARATRSRDPSCGALAVALRRVKKT